MPFIAPAVGAALIGAAATTAGGVMSAMAAKKQRQQELNKMYPTKTEQQLSNLESVRDRSASSLGKAPTPMSNPFVQAAQQGRDRLAEVRQKLAGLQQANAQRVGGTSYSSAPSNPFMG